MTLTALQDNIRLFPKVQLMNKPEEQKCSLKEEGFTQTPNNFFDKLMGEINSLSEMKVTLALIRKIYGWHKENDPDGDLISFSQFIEITKLSRPMVKQGLDAGVKRGSIIQVAKGQSFMYRLNLDNYQGEAPESKRGSKLQEARAARNPDRFSQSTGLDNKPVSSLDNKPETGLFNKHTKERLINKKEINITTPNGVGPTTIDLPDFVPVVSSHIPPDITKPKKEKKVKGKEENPLTKDPRMLSWRDFALAENYTYWPSVQAQKLIIDHIPPNQIPRWEFTIEDWLKHNHKVQNILGMVKVFWFGWEAFYSGKADKMVLPLVKQAQEGSLVHANT